MPRKPRKKKETTEIHVEHIDEAEETKPIRANLMMTTGEKAKPNLLEAKKAEINAILDTAPTMSINVTVRDREEKFRPAYKEFLAKLRQAVK